MSQMTTATMTMMTIAVMRQPQPQPERPFCRRTRLNTLLPLPLPTLEPPVVPPLPPELNKLPRLLPPAPEDSFLRHGVGARGRMPDVVMVGLRRRMASTARLGRLACDAM